MTSRNQSLDALRGIAILMVMGCHYPYFAWMKYGSLGVDLFFVLSGFLISGLLFAELESTGTIDVKRFLIRRGFKLYPGFYVFIAVMCGLAPSLRHWFLIEALFLQSYIVPMGTPLGPTWSLAVEEHFYLLLPLAILCLHRFDKLRLIPWIAIALFVICTILRSMSAQPFATHLRIDELFAGVMLRYLRARPLPFVRLPSLEPLSRIGVYSYSIYLWHSVIARLFNAADHRTALGLVAYSAISIAFGITMAKAIELPMLRVRDKFWPKRQNRAQSSGETSLRSSEPIVFCALNARGL